MLRNLFLILIFLILNFFSYTYLKNHYQDNRNTLIDNQVQELNHLYQSAVTTFRLNAKAVFENIIMQPDVLGILKQLPSADNKQVDALHNELYELLHKRYKNLQNSLYVRQLHFHQSDGRSFLRMHRPKKYGDSLIGIRHSIYVANTQKNYIEGFEEGRIFNGYRYVYPIISEGVHLGSVEIASFSAFFKRPTIVDIFLLRSMIRG